MTVNDSSVPISGCCAKPSDPNPTSHKTADPRTNASQIMCGALAADTRKGTRPSFSNAADPDQSRKLFTYLVQQAKAQHSPVGSGKFGADMAVTLTNDGPVTFWLEVAPRVTKAPSEPKSA